MPTDRRKNCGLCGAPLTWEKGNICGTCFDARNPALPPEAPIDPANAARCLRCGELVKPGEWCICSKSPDIPF